jgi:hypothetical protein
MSFPAVKEGLENNLAKQLSRETTLPYLRRVQHPTHGYFILVASDHAPWHLPVNMLDTEQVEARLDRMRQHFRYLEESLQTPAMPVHVVAAATMDSNVFDHLRKTDFKRRMERIENLNKHCQDSSSLRNVDLPTHDLY